MTLIRHELKQGRTALAIWTAIIAGMLALCVLIYPEMAGQMDEFSSMFADMGSFSAAFGMDKVNFGEFTGYFGVECGNVLGLGGAFFAALLGISALAKEEKEQTAEFLLTHPISRNKVLIQKFCAVLVQIILLNVVVILVVALSAFLVGETPGWKPFVLMFLAYFLLQLEIASICFGFSAFIRRGSLGIGLGIAALCYFLNIIANLTEEMAVLKYITPFGYTEGADIIANESLELKYLAVGFCLTLFGLAAAWGRYRKKDIL